MSELINSQILFFKEQILSAFGTNATDDKAFSHVILKYFYNVDISDQNDWVTDGSNDGGIDFLYFDEEEVKVIVCQSKYTSSLSYDQVIHELNKMFSTVQNFKKSHTGIYNEKLRKALQNALDRLPDDNPDNIEYCIFTTASLNMERLKKKINNNEHSFPTEAVSIYTSYDIEKGIQRAQEQVSTVKEEKLIIDQSNNFLEYESEVLHGVMCNVLSTSIIQLFNKYSGAGLFDLNIRRYIRNTLVDKGINETLDKDRSNFWFLNNGIIIACTDFSIEGNTLRLTDFSIVNGAQTTTLIGTYKGNNTKEFFIPCKIIATKDNSRAVEFYTKIAEATNSQKPIYPRDLKSNAPEMVALSRILKQEGIYLEIKRGFIPKWNYNYAIKNDNLGQILLSFSHQQPGTARSGKRRIFDTPVIYDKLFKVNYNKDPQKKAFIKDLVDLEYRYSEIEKKLKVAGLTSEQIEVLKNGKQTIFALLGVCYRLVNEDISKAELQSDPKSLATIPFVYGGHISNYRQDDLENKLTELIKVIVYIVAGAYKMAEQENRTTSVSNFMKTDLKYYNDIVSRFSEQLSLMYGYGDSIRKCYDIFKRL
jgi:hypothetical protein